MVQENTKRRRLSESTAQGRDDVGRRSKAARFNLHTLKRLKEAVERDPEIDLTQKFPSDYPDRLAEMRNLACKGFNRRLTHELIRANSSIDRPDPSVTDGLRALPPDDDIRMSLRPEDPITIRYPLSEAVRKLLAEGSLVNMADVCSETELPQALLRLMWRSEVLWKSAFPRNKMVFKCDSTTVIKAIRRAEDYTEYTALQYLETHKPALPAPRPLGLICMSGVSLIFMSYIPETTLREIWAQLGHSQKISVQNQLNDILTDLRSLTHPDGTPLGGVGGEGCKDVRRHLRRSMVPIMNVGDFEDFQFPDPNCGGHVFVNLLRQLSPLRQSSPPPTIKCVFTHGDIRPDNITVKVSNDGDCRVTGLLDWEYSGFYPEYYESIKSTNCMATNEHDDWYLFLPQCISVQHYQAWWSLNRIWTTLIE
jgi:hypothetical protein